MRRLLALVLKDLRQHLVAVLGIGALGAVSVLLTAVVAASKQVSAFEAHARFSILLLPVATLVLGNRLIVAEYQGRTQLFLEALPIRRWEMVATKYLLGLSALLGLGFGSIALSALVAWARESVEPRFLLFLAGRTAGFAFCVWSIAFAMGFTGRWRIPIYIGALFAIAVVAEATDVELAKVGPLALVDPNTLPFERHSFPTGALLESLGIGAAWLALGLALSLMHEGSVAESLARRMTQKEKAAVATALFAALIGAVALDERREKQPYDFGSGAVLRAVRAPVHVLYLNPSRLEDAQALLDVLESDLAELAELLGRELPATRVAFRATLDGRTFEKAELRHNDGVLLRASFSRSGDFDLRAFRAFVVRNVLVTATKDRADFEPKAFALDGFSRWWVERDGDEATRSRLLLRALWGARDGAPDDDQVRRWWAQRERLGEPIAQALAWSALDLLAELRGQTAVEQLARRLYGRAPAHDFSELWHELEHPFESDFEAASSVPWHDFLGLWRERLAQLAEDPRLRAALAAIPKVNAELEVAGQFGSMREVRYGFALDGPPDGSGSALGEIGSAAPPHLCSLLHLEIGPFDEPLEARALLREEHPWTESRLAESFVLPGRYGAGQRVFLALECESSVLGCPVRLKAERRELR
ncbi:MAG: hypothetical protein ACOX6T_09590 [Myxococcales bacterium]|jgi:hypothetical protein